MFHIIFPLKSEAQILRLKNQKFRPDNVEFPYLSFETDMRPEIAIATSF